jgi:hypothetical protein
VYHRYLANCERGIGRLEEEEEEKQQDLEKLDEEADDEPDCINTPGGTRHSTRFDPTRRSPLPLPLPLDDRLLISQDPGKMVCSLCGATLQSSHACLLRWNQTCRVCYWGL